MRHCNLLLLYYISINDNWYLKIFFAFEEFTSGNFDFQNGWRNEFKDNNEKSGNRCRKRGSHQIDFEAVGPRNGHADSMGVK